MNNHKDTKVIILENSIKLFFEIGYNNTTMRMIAKESGIKHPSIYKHFKSKEDIVGVFVFRYIRGIVHMTRRYILDHIGVSKHDAFLFYWTAHMHYSHADARFKRYQLEYFNNSQILGLNNDFFAQVFINIMHWEFDKTASDHKIYSRVLQSIVIIVTNMYMNDEIELASALANLFELMYDVMREENPVDEEYAQKFIDQLDYEKYLSYDLLEDVLLTDFGKAYEENDRNLFI